MKLKFSILFIFICLVFSAVSQKSDKHYSLIMDYPKDAELNGVEGTIIVRFDLNAECSIHNISQDTILGFGCEKALLKSLCDLEEALKKDFDGVCVPMYSAKLPAVFELEKETLSWE